MSQERFMPFDQFTARYYPDSSDFILTRTKKVDAVYTPDVQKMLEKLNYSLVDDVIADVVDPDTTTSSTTTKSKSKSNSNAKATVAPPPPSSRTTRSSRSLVVSSSSDSENVSIVDPPFEDAGDDFDIGSPDDYGVSDSVSPESVDLEDGNLVDIDESSDAASGDDNGFASRRTRNRSGSSSKSSSNAKSTSKSNQKSNIRSRTKGRKAASLLSSADEEEEPKPSHSMALVPTNKSNAMVAFAPPVIGDHPEKLNEFQVKTLKNVTDQLVNHIDQFKPECQGDIHALFYYLNKIQDGFGRPKNDDENEEEVMSKKEKTTTKTKKKAVKSAKVEKKATRGTRRSRRNRW
ncbi:unnamed protein product [Ambrosiozyma monospora]|uniref:Unnamed protein product n=1 Tax=Ambrosiozyma monospora TaxID=43982 RepID=A0A9W6YVL6_AMBMO|nr:unnamed protein product [Ambrosiozyma monospora]